MQLGTCGSVLCAVSLTLRRCGEEFAEVDADPGDSSIAGTAVASFAGVHVSLNQNNRKIKRYHRKYLSDLQ